jgi:DNA-binding transcriptional ArsR family regulator
MPRRVKTQGLGDTLLHPIRLRIVRSLELNGAQTVGQLARTLSSVPQPTLYRHIKALADAGWLKSRSTLRGDRGAPERVYELAEVGSLTIAPRGRQRTRERLRRYYLAMLAAQTAEFDAALSEDPFPENHFIFRRSLIFVNDAEREEVDCILARLHELSRNDHEGRVALDLGILIFPAKRF